MEFDDRGEWVIRAAAAEEDALETTAGYDDVAPEATEYIDELVHPGGPFETAEDLTRYLRINPDCAHNLWQVVDVGE